MSNNTKGLITIFGLIGSGYLLGAKFTKARYEKTIAVLKAKDTLNNMATNIMQGMIDIQNKALVKDWCSEEKEEELS